MNTSKTTDMTAEMITGSVTSADGTVIGYLRTGQGPAVVLLHGSNESARSHTRLARALADAFTVYLPDRRGRGLSGRHKPDHNMRTEIEDLAAVLAESGAGRVFGVSVDALIALQAARVLPAIRQVAAYEQALLMDQSGRYTAWVTRFDQEMARGQVADALITSLRGLDLAPPALALLPRRLLVAVTNMAMKKEDTQAASEDVTMRKLAPTLRYEGLLLAEMAGTIATFADVPADVLLLGGGMKPAGVHQARVRRPGSHPAAQPACCVPRPRPRRLRRSAGRPTGAGGPEAVAPEICSFFAG